MDDIYCMLYENGEITFTKSPCESCSSEKNTNYIYKGKVFCLKCLYQQLKLLYKFYE